MVSTAGKLFAMDSGITKVAGAPVPITRKPWFSVGTSAVQRYVIDRVARVSRVSFTENRTGLPTASVSPGGSAMVYGTFWRLVSISCTSGTSRDSNLTDFNIDSLRPSRATSKTQG